MDYVVSAKVEKLFIEKNYRVNTIITMKYGLKRLMPVYDVKEILDYDKMMTNLNKIEKTSSKRYLVNVIIQCLTGETVGTKGNIRKIYKTTLEQYNRTLQELTNKNRYETENEPLNEKDSKNFMSLKELETIRERERQKFETLEKKGKTENKIKYNDKITYEGKKALIKYLIACLYTYIPPLRPNELANVKIVYEDDKIGNKLITKDWIMIIREYKNKKKMMIDRKIDVLGELQKVIEKRIKYIEGSYLLPMLMTIDTKNERGMNSSCLTGLMRKIFTINNKTVTTDLMRKMYIINHGDRTITERKRDATIMGHQYSTAETVYKRNPRING